MKLDLKNLCSQNQIFPRGIIHVGAYEGKDIKTYQALNISKILFIEANPTVFERLKTNITEASIDVQAVNYAISNQNGKVKLYVNSMGKSSSILPLKFYRNIYPNIKETHQLTVESKTLDTLLPELGLTPGDFNILNLDIQGAELLALQGATNLLKYIDAVYTKVNYEELYEGCALAEKIDEFLAQNGFGKIAEATPFHPSWGDVFYVRKQVISMSTLGKNGGLGNQIFQYGFLKIYAQENGLSVEAPKWIGQELFGHKDREISEDLPEVSENDNEFILGNTKILKNVDIHGNFLYHTRYYAPFKEYFCSLFQPALEIEEKVKVAWEKLHSYGKTIIGLHLQSHSEENSNFAVAPSEWYKIWLDGLWETLEEPVLFIASDNIEELPLVYFSEYHPLTVQDLEIEVNREYLNFFLLSKCDFVAISNTPFAFAACLLNEVGKYFFRPHFSTSKLIPFEPWNSTPVFRDVDISEIGNSVSLEVKFQENQAELENIQSQKDELSQKLVSTQSQLQQNREELENIQSQRDQILEELGKSHSQLQQNQEKAENSEAQLQQIQTELENTKSQRDEFSAKLVSAQSQLQQNQEKAQNSEKQLQKIHTELENIQSQRDQILEELEKSQSQLQQNQEKAENSEAQLQKIHTELENTKSQRDEFSAKLVSAQSQLQQNQEKAEKSEAQLQKIHTELENTKSQRDEFSAKLVSAQSQLQQNKEKAENTEAQLQKIHTELENTKSQRDEFSQKLVSAQSQLQQNQEKAKKTEAKLQQIQTEVDKYSSELHDAREELEITQFQLDEVQAELEQSQSNYFKYQEELNSSQSQLQETQTELEKTKLKLENKDKIQLDQNQKNYAAHLKNLAKILAETIPD
ncbi:FkbM family methyltransferase [Okeania sp. SIO2B3]|uniref:FkbM family methyltransferase n=1 Tax=Okeania sp. SIO2B3 TaxID=2607784 RepID=UPI0013C10425|nr:FkbM family methyltransferase [Okeania sp. SIO2B3]NET44321.1 FkbM family methyltransferase [Okeania sp. SIO2B3]